MFSNKFIEVVCDTGEMGNSEGRIILVHRLYDDTFYTISKKQLYKNIKRNSIYYGAPFNPKTKGYLVRHGKRGTKYVAVIKTRKNGKLTRTWLGTFDTPEDAHSRWLKATLSKSTSKGDENSGQNQAATRHSQN